MDSLYIAILDLLNGLLPSAVVENYQGLNEMMAYFITIAVIYTFLLRPLLKLARVVK